MNKDDKVVFAQDYFCNQDDIENFYHENTKLHEYFLTTLYNREILASHSQIIFHFPLGVALRCDLAPTTKVGIS